VVHAARSSNPVGDVLPGDERAVSRVEDWFRQYAETHDPAVRERIIVAYLGLADRLADRYRSSRGVTPEDLRQTARVGLVAAVDRYDPGYGSPFVPYAVACVVGEIKRCLRDTSWRVHVSRPAKERSLRVLKALDELPHTLGRSPTVTELAGHVGLTEDDALEAIEVAHTRQEVSLDQQVGEDGDTSLGDRLPAAPPREEPEDLLLLPGLVDSLPELERRIVVLRFFHDLDQYEIAGRVGCSQMHVSRLLRRALDRLRAQLLIS
jgi:RNA polymerase sigma-B factor